MNQQSFLILFIMHLGVFCDTVESLTLERRRRQSPYSQSYAASTWNGPPLTREQVYAAQPPIASSSYGGTGLAPRPRPLPQVDMFPEPRPAKIIGYYNPQSDIKPASAWGKWWNWTYLRWNAPIYTTVSDYSKQGTSYYP